MSFKDVLISYSLFGIFALALITFGVQMSQDNNANNTITDNPIINSTFNKLQSNLSVFQSNAQDIGYSSYL